MTDKLSDEEYYSAAHTITYKIYLDDLPDEMYSALTKDILRRIRVYPIHFGGKEGWSKFVFYDPETDNDGPEIDLREWLTKSIDSAKKDLQEDAEEFYRDAHDLFVFLAERTKGFLEETKESSE